jgi:hypothetical protein
MPGKQVKDWDKYHAIRRENPKMSKESAARIANSQGKKGKKK